MTIRVIALGSELGGDDAAALRAAAALERADDVELVLAGRPGPDLVELLEDARVILVDVVRKGLAPGEIVTLDLSALRARGLSSGSTSSHDLGPIEALRLGEALGRPPPRGTFVGLGGASFAPGPALSEPVAAALPRLVTAVEAAIEKERAHA